LHIDWLCNQFLFFGLDIITAIIQDCLSWDSCSTHDQGVLGVIMVNFKKKDFFNCITGEDNDGSTYGTSAVIFRRSNNVELIYDSHNNYLGLRISTGKYENENNEKNKGKYIWSKGPYYYKSPEDLKIWEGIKCSKTNGIKIGSEAFVEINKKELTKSKS